MIERLSVMTGAVVVTALVGVLVFRGIESVQREEGLRRQVLAERLFDELERELADIVTEEENRPFLHYTYLYAPNTAVGSGGLSVSPISALPVDPVRVGYFQIGPDGTLTTPYRPAQGATVNPIDQVESVERRIRESIGTLRPHTTEKVPVTTRRKRPPSKESSFKGGKPLVSSFNRQLNTVTPRVAMNSSVQQQQVDNFIGNNDVTSWVQVDPQDNDRSAQVQVEPFSMVQSGASWVLHRTVQVENRRWTQGLVLDRNALLSELETTVVPEELKSGIQLAWDADGRWTHTFAEPFDSLTVAVDLSTLPPQRSTRDFWAVALALLVVCFLAGGLAVRWVRASRELARQRGDFVAAVSHELRTPLTSIRMYSEMLESGMVPDLDKQQGYYKTIRLESERLGRLVEDVLTFSKLERGQSTEGKSGRLGEVVRECTRLFEPLARADDARWNVTVAEDCEAIEVADRDALVQVLTNLVDNALKFSRGGSEVAVDVSAAREGDRVALRVRDRGPGVDPRFLPHVFEPFTRAEAELTRKTKGTGIGLALVAGLIERQGGSVSARNASPGFEVIVMLPT